MITMPAPITADGDIFLHELEGLKVSLFFQQDDGTPRDMTAATVAFVTPSGVRIVMTAGVTPDELVLTIDKGAIPAGTQKFAVVDETAVPPNLVWSGMITVRDFA